MGTPLGRVGKSHERLTNDTIIPLMSLIRIENGGFEAQILLEVGGRIVAYNRIGSPNLLESDPSLWNEKKEERITPAPDMLDFRAYNGHEVWLGPQSQWWKQQNLNDEKKDSDLFWPPDPYISFGNYSITLQSKEALQIEGEPSPISGIKMTKKISILENGNLRFEVSVQNIRKTPVAWDLWLITRVNGMNPNFAPIDDPSEFELGEPSHPWQGKPTYKIENGYFSFTPENYDGSFEECTGKAFLRTSHPVIYTQCGEEWLKLSFDHHNPCDIHPEQAEIELYNFVCKDPKNCLLELEYHTPYQTLMPGETMQTSSLWSVGEAPPKRG